MSRSLSDGPPSGYAALKERYELPTSRDGLKTEIARILDLGGVQKMLVKVGSQIQVERWVSKNNPAAAVAEDQNPLEQALAGDVQDLHSSERDPFHLLFLLFVTLQKNSVVAKHFLVPDPLVLRKWLDLPQHIDLSTLFGVPVIVAGDLPDDTCLLVAESEADTIFTLRFTLGDE